MSRILLYHSSYHCNLFLITMQSFARVSACILLVVGNTADNGYYTLQGVKVNRPTSKGIYMHQGKKIIFK